MSEQTTPDASTGTSEASEPEAVAVEVGSEDLEHGWVRAELARDGRLEVVKRLEGDEERFDGRIEASQAESLTQAASGLARREPRERKDYRPVPDEPRYRIAVLVQGKETTEIDVWRGQLDEEPEARKLIAELRQAVESATDGRALL